MKKLLIVFVVVFLVLSVSAVSMAKSSITINPFGALFGFYDAQFESQLGNNAGLILGGRYFSYGDLDTLKLSGFGGRLGFRIYPTAAFSGFFLQGHGGYNMVTLATGSDSASGSSIPIEAQAGFKWVTDNGFTFEFGIGEAYTFYQVQDPNAVNGFGTYIVLNVGTTF